MAYFVMYRAHSLLPPLCTPPPLPLHPSVPPLSPPLPCPLARCGDAVDDDISIITSKSSELNIVLPAKTEQEDPVEIPVPEQVFVSESVCASLSASVTEPVPVAVSVAVSACVYD